MIDFTTKIGHKAKKHIDKEYFIWFTTVSTDLTPQPRPVWFIWEDNSFLIFSKPGAFKVSHVRQHPNVALHFNTDDKADKDVIVFLGLAEIDSTVSPAHLVSAYIKKYDSGITKDEGMTLEEFGKEYSLAIRVKPTKLRGW